MKYRRLGEAGMRVSAVSFGGWINWGEGKLAEDEARRIVLRAYELGVNFFDLADIYGRGKAEEQMGQTLRQFPRHTLVISTKVYWPMSDDINDRGLSRKHIYESIHRSLKRLGTDYVDIYFCHRPDPETPLLETARTMHDLVTQGKVLYWGTSEWSGAQIQAVLDICDKHNLVRPQTEQPQYSMLVRDVVEQDVIPVAQPNGIGLVVWSPLAQGMLTGKYDDGIPQEGTRFSRETWLKDRYFTEANMQKVKQLKPLADELGLTRGQLALAWCLRQSTVSSVITGATKVAQLEENVKAAEITLSDDVIARVEAVLNA